MHSSPIFSIHAGSNAEGHLMAHKAILEQYPVFEAMCKDGFTEGQSSELNLPEDDYNQVALSTCSIGTIQTVPGIFNGQSLCPIRSSHLHIIRQAPTPRTKIQSVDGTAQLQS